MQGLVLPIQSLNLLPCAYSVITWAIRDVIRDVMKDANQKHGTCWKGVR